MGAVSLASADFVSAVAVLSSSPSPAAGAGPSSCSSSSLSAFSAPGKSSGSAWASW